MVSKAKHPAAAPSRGAKAHAPRPARISAAGRPAKLHQNFRFLEAFFEHSLECLVLLDKQFNFIRVNSLYARVAGRPVSDFPGRNYFDLYPSPETRTLFQTVLRTKSPYQTTSSPFVFPDHPDWGVTYWDWTLVPVLDRSGGVECLIYSLRDVSLRKRMERALQENEERYRSLVTATAQIVWTTNPAGEVVQELPSWQGFTGQTREQYQGAGWMNAVHPDDRERTSRVWLAALAATSLYETEYRLLRHDGEYRYVVVRGVPVLASGGRIREWVGTCTDVTERREAERRRDFTNALLALFAQKSSCKQYLDAVVEIVRSWSGAQGVGIRIVNEREEIPYESAFGFDPEFLAQEQCLFLRNDTCCCARVIAGGEAAGADPALATPGGSWRCDNTAAYLSGLPPARRTHFLGHCVKSGFASLAVVPIQYRQQSIGAVHLADRQPGRFSAATVEFVESMTPLLGEAIHRFQAEAELGEYRERLEDLVKQRTQDLESANARLQVEIAERKRAQEVLQQTAAELERSNRDLEQFAYVASHDLQEPLRAVGGYVRLLQHRFPQHVDPKALEFISGAAEGAARMERLISDLLAFSRVGTRPVDPVSCDFNVLLGDALQNLQASIEDSAARIQAERLPCLCADPTQMVQLFQNLIGNAIKFRGGAPPRIEVGARLESDRWIFHVRDNGIGIEPRYFNRIFQIFQRLHTRRQYPGTGIGLAICKKIIERHEGTIWVESQPGRGTTFYFALPQSSSIKLPVV